VIIVDDCVAAMKKMEDNSFDAVVTDPPYGLEFMGQKWDALSSSDSAALNNPSSAGGFQDGSGGNPYSRSRIRHGKKASSIEMLHWHQKWAEEALRVLKPGGYMLVFGGSRTYHVMAMGVELAGFEIRDQIQWIYGQGFPKSRNIGNDLPNRKGWGTALKPAHEPIVMARKPFKGSVAKNIESHRTGAINIDGCRVSECDGTERWPANVVHDGSEQVKQTMKEAARFFYCAKPSKKEKSAGLGEEFETKQTTGGGGLTSEELGGKFGSIKAPSKNHHPTVKPVRLMSYLCRLVTPIGGLVLDPFAGSGSTGVAAVSEGLDFIGIERDPEYAEIARARIENACR